jgi:class 3 adenylate cyclase
VEKIEARPKLLARIGIHSGAVVVGAGGGFLLISTENEVRN